MATAQVSVTRGADATLVVHVSGAWRIDAGLPTLEPVAQALTQPTPRVVFDTAQVQSWDSSLLVFVRRVLGLCSAHDVEADRSGLPEGIRRLLALSEAVAGQRPPAPKRLSPVARVGTHAIALSSSFRDLLQLLGELAISFVHFVLGRARLRRSDLLMEIQAASAESLPIVSVVSFLLGMILAFVGGVTLRPFGADIYVANVVTIAMVRELGPVMTAIVMAGRTGSAYAAQLGTMKVTQEIDALTTMGLPSSEFLVLPRVLALSLMMPLLVIYANFTGLVGGALVAALGDSTGGEYWRQAQGSISLTTFWVGMAKSAVFGVVVAVCGCYQGLRAGKSAAAVGDAATAAVVTSIVWIIVVDGAFAVVLYLLGI
jgi:phospholipid/cholesterol/gamma-HCH transport system permease protein